MAASVLAYLGKIGDGVYSTIVVAVAGAYLAANVTQKATARDYAGDLSTHVGGTD